MSAAPLRAQTTERRIVIGSKPFTENRLLSEIMAQLIEANTDIVVDRIVNLGGTTVVFSALRDGQIDLYPSTPAPAGASSSAAPTASTSRSARTST